MRDDAGASGKTDAFKALTEMVGSGPFKWNAKERVVGSLAVYDRFDGYKPRESGTPEWTSGPKVVNFDRVEWHVSRIPVPRPRPCRAGNGLVGEPAPTT